MDHINECVDKYRAYKNHDINKYFTKEELRFKFDKELMDLFILLIWQYGQNTEWANLFEERSIRFQQKYEEFCIWHIRTAENPQDTDCSAHLHDGKIFKCPYKSLEERKRAEYPCSDYKPKF
jgi:hypothetical protein